MGYIANTGDKTVKEKLLEFNDTHFKKKFRINHPIGSDATIQKLWFGCIWIFYIKFEDAGLDTFQDALDYMDKLEA